MFGSQTLDVAIGIIVVFILVSIVCSAVREGIEAWLKTRAAYLEHGIRELLHDKGAVGLARSFYNHPLIYCLYSGDYKPGSVTKRSMKGGDLPSYIPSNSFALALMDIVARGPQADAGSSDGGAPVISLDAIRANVANLQNAAVQRVLLSAIDTAQGDLNRAQANIATWFDTGMDRVSGWYKRKTQWILFFVGLFVAVSMNVNTIAIADYLAHNEAARQQLIQVAEQLKGSQPDAKRAQTQLESLNVPIGWPAPPTERPPSLFWSYVAPLLGWLITAFAASLGAPFWFDVLNKVMVIRSTVKPHEKSPEESSEDRQQKPAAPQTIVVQTPAAGEGTTTAPPPPAPAPPTPVSALGGDVESDVDGCDAIDQDSPTTPDDQLPAAIGGVA